MINYEYCKREEGREKDKGVMIVMCVLTYLWVVFWSGTLTGEREREREREREKEREREGGREGE